MKKTLKPAKDTGTCPICWGDDKIQKKDGTLHKHGHDGLNGGPCQGSHKMPSSTKPAASTSASVTLRPERGSNPQESHSSLANQTSNDTLDEPSATLHHPPWTPLITRVHKASRATCAAVLLSIVIRIISSPANFEAWDNLFSFAPTILAKPARGGATRNLANVVLKRLSECNDKPTSKSIPQRPTRYKPRNNED